MAPPHVGNSPSSAHVETASGTNENTSSALFPLHRCKILHLVRHAQARHNAEDKDYFDPELTPLGWQQVDNLRRHVQASGLSKKIELVVVSPLLRALQTAVGVFGSESQEEETSMAVMVTKAGNNSSAISSTCFPHLLALENCREHWGFYLASKRRSVSEYSKCFPAIDFSLMENNEDILWKAEEMEPREETAERAKEFLEWLWTRSEREIAVVSHTLFLELTLTKCGKDCHPLVKEELTMHFSNCELRSLMLVDRSAIGADASCTNYTKNTPGGC